MPGREDTQTAGPAATEIQQSAESVTKLLRDPAQSASQKLDFASKLWHGSKVFIPGKQELILEWISSELFNGIKKNLKVSKRVGEAPHLNLPHWKLFAEVIGKFAELKARQEVATFSSTASLGTRTYTVKARLMDVFVALLDDLRNLLTTEITSEEGEAVLGLLQTAHECFSRLVSSLPEVLRPTLELLISLAQSSSQFFVISSPTTGGNPCAPVAAQYLESVLAMLTKAFHQYPNQKKVFTLFITNLLDPFLALRQQILALPGDTIPQAQHGHILGLLRALIRDALFHKEHMPEFVAVLHQLSESQAGVPTEKLAYPKQLFDHLRAMISGNDDVPEWISSSLPLLFELFIESSRAHLKVRFTAASPSFNLFHQFYAMVAERAPSSSDATTSELAYLSMSVDLLRQCHTLDVYRATNDNESKKQRNYFEALNRMLLAMAMQLPASNHCSLFRGLNALLLLDHTVLETNLSELWRFILSPSPEARREAVNLCCELVRTFTKSRQLDVLIESCLASVRSHHIDQDARTASSVTFCSAECLAELSSSVAALLPAQTIGIMQTLRGILLEHYLPAASHEPPTKKRKTKQAGGAGNAGRPSPELPILLLCQVLQHARISEGQRTTANAIVDELHSAFIVPVLASINEQEAAVPGAGLFTGLYLQLTLLKYSPTDYWSNNMDTAAVQRMVLAFSKVKLEPRVMYLKSEIVLCHLDRVASTTVDPLTVSGCQKLAQGILTDLADMPTNYQAIWDGRVNALSEENECVGRWTSVVNHLPAVSRLVDQKDLKIVVNQLLDTLDVAQEASLARHTLKSVTADLLKSALFYELDNIKSALVPELVTRMSAPLLAALPSSAIHEGIATLAALKNNTSFLGDARSKFLSIFGPDAHTRIKVSSSAFLKTLPYLQFLHIFPTTYFDPLIRDVIIRMVSLLELTGFRGLLLSSDSKKQQIGLQFGSICRNICIRFLTDREDKALSLLGPSVLIHLIRSLERYAVCERKLAAAAVPNATQFLGQAARATLAMETLLILRAWRMAPKSSGGASPHEFLAIIFREVASMADGAHRLQVAIHLLRPTVEWFEVKRKRAEKIGDGDKSTIAAEIKVGDGLVQEFLDGFEESVLRVLQDIATASEPGAEGAEIVDMTTSGAERALLAFEVYRLVLAFYKSNGSPKVAVYLALLASLVAGSIRTLTEWSLTTSVDQSLRSAYSLLAVNFLATFAMNIRDIRPAVDPTAMKSLAQLIGYIMDTAPTGSDAILTAEEAMKRLVSDSSKPQYLDLVAYAVDVLERAPAAMSAVALVATDGRTPSPIKIVEIIMAGDNQEVGRTIVRRVLPNVIIKLAQVLQVTTSVSCVLDILRMFTRAASDKYLTLRHSDIGLMFGGIAAVLSGSSNLASALPSPSEIEESDPTPESVVEIFNALYRLLLALLRFRKELVVQAIAPLGAVIKDLLLCFRVRTRNVDPRSMRGKGGGATLSGVHIETTPSLARYAPLPPECASDLARVLVALSQKSLLTSQTDQLAASASASASTQPSAVTTSAAATVKPFTKHAPFLLSAVLQIQISPRPLAPEAKHELMDGIYALLDLCGDHGREAVLAASDPHGGARPLLKATVAEWEQHHRYHGKV
ncbi:rRNA primary transcript metabolism protein [Geranomyces variabilis]|uniref:rRNA primary transcript metabolism protein n=1 Tax=Geranomyces variabilis TaxID=109894 RepID=A0AAD5XQC0_9FUNG|nr:rRNA primary transcript metabolism protein [Geranomyces variabilis]